MIKKCYRFLLFAGLLLLFSGCSKIDSTNTKPIITTSTTQTVTTTLSTEITTNLSTTEITSKRIVQISFFLFEGEDIISVFSEEGAIVSLPQPSRKGYTFLGWRFEESFDQPGFYSLEVPSYNLNLFAKWEINQYNLRIYDNSNLLVETFIVDYDQILTDIDFPDFLLEGYTFVGLYLDENREQLLDYNRMPAA